MRAKKVHIVVKIRRGENLARILKCSAGTILAQRRWNRELSSTWSEPGSKLKLSVFDKRIALFQQMEKLQFFQKKSSIIRRERRESNVAQDFNLTSFIPLIL